ncbi:MAG TPA: aspartate aminotransferase family protein [Quisquiliibacterium sp.]|nr:aspartate aminotransferase family protein [Quisquiliibacterium sp.]HPA91361.1 aspartate aminotransferase family protein [Quisquiliibacterium sp.]HQD82583.1 aspartate aminotransferase family protein [Quisquiliibacterium sp.]HQN13517.1 aspartate aminotransferase family protein [Quisquiliibacterium sp.]HQP65627.1 aspartate aminotransferase family protein [Quisquiliibacterium sp.]
MPFTANRQFKAAPRLIQRAEGMYYYTPDGRQVLDAQAGLWCVNAGHCRTPIVQAIAQAAGSLDFAPTFQMGHPMAFELAERLVALAGKPFNHVFFCNSGSEAVDSALKIALAYHRVRGEGQRTRFIGRERGYHGVGFGGISVGGIVGNRKMFGTMLPGVDHLPQTWNLKEQAFSRGQPQWGAHLADELERIVALHDASTIAAVIVEPVAGSAGVLVPPVGYLERLREITAKHGILLIFDEVITGFGRIGKPFGFQQLGVTPDLYTVAKGINSGTVPMGGVFAREGIYEAFMQGPQTAIEFAHGYTYSAHPLACAAALACLDVYRDEGLLTRAGELAGYWEDALHSLRGLPHVIDIRNIGLMGAVELAPRPGAAGARAFDVHVKAFFEENLLVRFTGDILALSPPLIVEKAQIDRIVDGLRRVLSKLD